MSIGKGEKRMLVLLGVVVLLAAWLQLTAPKPSGGHANIAGKILPLEQAQKQYHADLAAYQTLKSQQADLQGDVAHFCYDVPPDTLIPRIIEQLEQISHQSSVHLKEIRPLRLEVTPSGQLMRVPIQVQFQAPFQPNVVKFLYYVERPKGHLVIEKLDIGSKDTHQQAVSVTAQITAYTRSVVSSGAPSEGGEENANQ